LYKNYGVQGKGADREKGGGERHIAESKGNAGSYTKAFVFSYATLAEYSLCIGSQSPTFGKSKKRLIF